MKSFRNLRIFAVVLMVSVTALLSAGCKAKTTGQKDKKEETQKIIVTDLEGTSDKKKISDARKTSGNASQGIERWWLKRNEDHQQPEVSDKIDLSKYDAYYVAPKCKTKTLYLTFDCGYENGFTPKILDVLKKEKVTAAFFVTKPFIREEAKLVKRMKKEGHIVGNHTVHHKSMPTLSDRDNKQEIIDCAQYCKEATGYEMDPFIRPPMGEYNERTLALTKKMGYRTIFWSMAYVDFNVNQQPGKEYVIEHFQKYIHKGAIPLMHNVSQSNAEALETVIKNLKKEGYRFESLKKLPAY